MLEVSEHQPDSDYILFLKFCDSQNRDLPFGFALKPVSLNPKKTQQTQQTQQNQQHTLTFALRPVSVHQKKPNTTTHTDEHPNLIYQSLSTGSRRRWRRLVAVARQSRGSGTAPSSPRWTGFRATSGSAGKKNLDPGVGVG